MQAIIVSCTIKVVIEFLESYREVYINQQNIPNAYVLSFNYVVSILYRYSKVIS